MDSLKSLSIELIQQGLLDNEPAKDKALSQDFRDVFKMKDRQIIVQAATANKSLSDGFLKIVRGYDSILPLIQFLKFLRTCLGSSNILESNRIDEILLRFGSETPDSSLSNVKRRQLTTGTDLKSTEVVTTSKLDITANIVDSSQSTEPPILPPSNIELVSVSSMPFLDENDKLVIGITTPSMPLLDENCELVTGITTPSMPPLGEKNELVVGIALPIFMMLNR